MPKQKTDDLIQLIKSLTRAEKRHFRLFVGRNQASDDILFLQLFDMLDKYKEYDEDMILRKLPAIKKTQLSNLKAHLYKQLLTSLRLLNRNHVEDLQIRELIDHSKVLYDKGLYRQSLDILDKAKARAIKGKFYAIALEIIEFEKYIEAQYITRSIEGRAEELTTAALEINKILMDTNRFSNLALQMYGLYIKVGFARDEKDHDYVKNFFRNKLPDIDYKKIDFFGKIYYCQAHIWYYHMIQDFPMSYRYAQRWVDLFHEEPELKLLNVPMYLKGMHNLLNVLFNLLYYKKFEKTLNELKEFANEYDITQNKNIEGLYYLFLYNHTIKKYFIEGAFSEGVKLISKVVELIDEDEYNWDNHRIMLFYYRIACLYFGSGDNENAIEYLNMIINQKNPDYREDIQSFARILNLIAHYELGNAQLVEYQVKSVYRFLSKMEQLQSVLQEIFRFVRRVPRMRESEMKHEFITLKEKLLKLQNDPYEKRAFFYLDIISWLESKIENRPIQDIAREKFLKRQGLLEKGRLGD
ncbi:MAG: hypothetical protein IPJ74_05705 [Saprospiraceae bacterium]|nr:hypothetical protein [Saprospiraceae bacterium]